jgi:hypothetical protein
MTNKVFWLPTVWKHASYNHHAPYCRISIANIINKFTMLVKYVTSLPYSMGNPLGTTWLTQVLRILFPFYMKLIIIKQWFYMK